ncbi:MAG: FHA domain-containing protein [Candidatus Omnitrophica bacterium]|nr:FHA domain-containing protein [Candidatus Omnitrophota bacterium]
MRKYFRSIITFITILALLTGQSPAQMSNPELTPLAESTSVTSFLDVDTINVPPHLGEVRYLNKCDSDKVIIHIQDAHCNFFAQNKIFNIIDYFVSEYGMKSINMEGGAGEYNLNVFTSIPEPVLRKEVADYFVKKGQVNGAELYAIMNPEKSELWGVEEKELYLKNLKVYRDSLSYKDKVDGYLSMITAALDAFKKQLYAPELMEIDSNYAKYRAGDLELKNYLHLLIKKCSENKIDISSFSNLNTLAMTLEMEEKVNFKKADSEQYSLMDKLKRSLPRNQTQELAVKTLEYKQKVVTLKTFYAYLLGKASELRFDLGEYPSLTRYVDYINAYESVDRSRLMDEISGLETALKNRLFTDEDIKKLDRLSMDLSLLKNMFAFKLTRSDYRFYVDNKNSITASVFTDFIKRAANKYAVATPDLSGIEALDGYIGEITAFFEYSFSRDETFLANLKFDDIYGGKKAAILFTGGFHTENLARLFRENNISYISVIPKFQSDEGYKNPYFDLLAGFSTDIQLAIKPALSEIAMIAVASHLSTLGVEVWGGEGMDLFQVAVKIVKEMARIRAENLDKNEIALVANEAVIASIGQGERLEITIPEILARIDNSPEISPAELGTISGGYLPQEITDWFNDSDNLLKEWQIDKDVVRVTTERFALMFENGKPMKLTTALKTALTADEYGKVSLKLYDYQTLLTSGQPGAIQQVFKLFRSNVESSDKYIIGYKSALAIDFIEHLIETGDMDLLDEYLLHEVLENTSLGNSFPGDPKRRSGHRRIIEFTTPYYHPGISIDTPSGQTPLGKALREFIDNKAKMKVLDDHGILPDGDDIAVSMIGGKHPFTGQFYMGINSKGKGMGSEVKKVIPESLVTLLVGEIKNKGLSVSGDMSYDPISNRMGVSEYPIVFPHELGHVAFLNWLGPIPDRERFIKGNFGMITDSTPVLGVADVPVKVEEFRDIVGAHDRQRLTEFPLTWGNSLNELFAHNIERLTYGAPFLVCKDRGRGGIITTKYLLDFYRTSGFITDAERDHYLELYRRMNGIEARPTLGTGQGAVEYYAGVTPTETGSGYHISPDYIRESFLQTKIINYEKKLGRELTVIEELALRLEDSISPMKVAEVEGWVKTGRIDEILNLLSDGGFHLSDISKPHEGPDPDKQQFWKVRDISIPSQYIFLQKFMGHVKADSDIPFNRYSSANAYLSLNSAMKQDGKIADEDMDKGWSSPVSDVSLDMDSDSVNLLVEGTVMGERLNNIRPNMTVDQLSELAIYYGLEPPVLKNRENVLALRIDLAKAQLLWAVERNLISHQGLILLHEKYHRTGRAIIAGKSDDLALTTRRAITSFVSVYNDIYDWTMRHQLVADVLARLDNDPGSVSNTIMERALSLALLPVMPLNPQPGLSFDMHRSDTSSMIPRLITLNNDSDEIHFTISGKNADAPENEICSITAGAANVRMLRIGNENHTIEFNTPITIGNNFNNAEPNRYPRNSPGISRNHLMLTFYMLDGKILVKVTDRGSLNGTRMTVPKITSVLNPDEVSDLDDGIWYKAKNDRDLTDPAKDRINPVIDPKRVKFGNFILHFYGNRIVLTKLSRPGVILDSLSISEALKDGQELTIGRKGDIFRTHFVTELSVSREHFKLRRYGDTIILTDLESRNGTFTDKPTQWKRIAVGNIAPNPRFVKIGASRSAPVIEIISVMRDRASGNVEAVIRKGKERNVITGIGRILIGRDSEQIMVTHRQASREHCEIIPGSTDGWIVNDLNSRNGTFIPDPVYTEGANSENHSLIGKVFVNGVLKTGGFAVERPSDTLLTVKSTSGDNMEAIELSIPKDIPEKPTKEIIDTIQALLSKKGRSTLTEKDRKIVEKLITSLGSVSRAVPIDHMEENDANNDLKGIIDKNTGVIYLNRDLIDDPLALIHELGEGFIELPEGAEFAKMTRHTFMRGVGKDVRIAYATLLKEISPEGLKKLGIDDFIAELREKIKLTRPLGMSDSEEALIRYNSSQEHKILDASPKKEWLFGLQDHIDPDANQAFTLKLMSMRGDMLKGTVNIHLIRSPNPEMASVQTTIDQEFRRKADKNDKIKDQVIHFDDNPDNDLATRLKYAIDDLAMKAIARDKTSYPKITVDCITDSDKLTVKEVLSGYSPDIQNMVIIMYDPVDAATLSTYKPDEAKIIAVGDILCADSRIIAGEVNYNEAEKARILKKHMLFLNSCRFFEMNTESSDLIDNLDNVTDVTELNGILNTLFNKVFQGTIRMQITRINYQEIADWDEAQKEVLRSL